MGRMYSASFTGVSVAAAQDLFELLAPADMIVVLHSVRIGQASEEGDAQSEMLSIQIQKYTGTSGSGGSSPTIVPHVKSDTAATSVVEANNTTEATTLLTLISDAWNVQAGYLYQPTPEERIVLSPSTGLVITSPDVPADAITMNGTITFEEIGG